MGESPAFHNGYVIAGNARQDPKDNCDIGQHLSVFTNIVRVLQSSPREMTCGNESSDKTRSNIDLLV